MADDDAPLWETAPWQIEPDAALAEAERRLAATEQGGALDLDYMAALARFPDGLVARTDLTRIDADGTGIADLTPLAGLCALEVLHLDNTAVSALDGLSGLPALQELYVSGTQVSALDGLSGLPALQELWLNDTQVSALDGLAEVPGLWRLMLNLTPLGSLDGIGRLPALGDLEIDDTQVADLLPLRSLERLGTRDETENGLSFSGTPAAARDAAHRALAALDNEECARETLQFLNGTHPEWGGPPEPVDTAAREPIIEPEPPQPTSIGQPDGAVDAAAVLPALGIDPLLQDPHGWRFEVNATMLALFTRAADPPAAAEQLLERMRARLDKAKTAFAGANAGLAADIAKELRDVEQIVDQPLEAITGQAVILWEMSVALGHFAEQDQRAAADGRDLLDPERISAPRSAALRQLLTVSAAFVRQFPDVKKMDDEVGGFLREMFNRERTDALIEATVTRRVLEAQSADLVKALAAIAAADGRQADKARGFTQVGKVTLISAIAAGAMFAAEAFSNGFFEAAGQDAYSLTREQAQQLEFSQKAAEVMQKDPDLVRNAAADAPADVRAGCEAAIEAVRALPPLPAPRGAATPPVPPIKPKG